MNPWANSKRSPTIVVVGFKNACQSKVCSAASASAFIIVKSIRSTKKNKIPINTRIMNSSKRTLNSAGLCHVFVNAYLTFGQYPIRPTNPRDNKKVCYGDS